MSDKTDKKDDAINRCLDAFFPNDIGWRNTVEEVFDAGFAACISELAKEFSDKPILLDAAVSELADLQPRWIPVSERLPEKAGWYLVWASMSRYARVDFYSNGEWGITQVTAWFQLPEPYKGNKNYA